MRLHTKWGLAIGLATGLFFLAVVAARFYLVYFIEDRIRDACTTCELKIESSAWQLFPFGFNANQISFFGGTRGAFEIQAQIEYISIAFSLLPLLQRRLNISNISVNGLVLTMKDGDGRSPHQESSSHDFEYLISKTEIKRAKLIYIRNHVGTHAVLNIHDIDADFEAVGSLTDINDLPLLARAEGQIEKSGRVSVRVQASKRKPVDADLKVQARGQDLSDLTAFFKPNAGVELKGQLIEGSAEAKVRGAESTTTVRAEYKELDVHLDKMYDRNEITAFFMNIGTHLAMNRSDVGYLPEKSVHLTREGDERIVGFVLRGLKEAAIKVTESRPKKGAARPSARSTE